MAAGKMNDTGKQKGKQKGSKECKVSRNSGSTCVPFGEFRAEPPRPPLPGRTSSLPPEVWQNLVPPPCRRAGASAYIVTEKILSGATHTVTITTGEMPKCSCGGPQATREPCEHVIIVADKFALPLDSIVHRTDTTAAWKAMYEAGGEPPAYSSAAWRPPHRALGTLEVPVVFRAARLRRRAEPRKKSKVEIATASRARMHRRKEDRQAAQAAQTSGANARRNMRAPERLNL